MKFVKVRVKVFNAVCKSKLHFFCSFMVLTINDKRLCIRENLMFLSKYSRKFVFLQSQLYKICMKQKLDLNNVTFPEIG